QFTPDNRYLITSSDDGTALVWDVYQLSARPLTERVWEDLASTDGRIAFTAVCSLVASPEQAARILQERLSHPRLDARQIQRWIADLDADSYQVRREAERQLKALDDHVEQDVREALRRKPAIEARLRLERLLALIERPNSESWRRARALEVLEQIAT